MIFLLLWYSKLIFTNRTWCHCRDPPSWSCAEDIFCGGWKFLCKPNGEICSKSHRGTHSSAAFLSNEVSSIIVDFVYSICNKIKFKLKREALAKFRTVLSKYASCTQPESRLTDLEWPLNSTQNQILKLHFSRVLRSIKMVLCCT